MISVFKLNAIMLGVVKLSAIALNAVKLSVIMLSVVKLSVYYELFFYELFFPNFCAVMEIRLRRNKINRHRDQWKRSIVVKTLRETVHRTQHKVELKWNY